MNLAISHLGVPATFETSCQVLVELLALPDLIRYEDSICENLLPVLTTGIVRDEFSKAIQGNRLTKWTRKILTLMSFNRTRRRYSQISVSTVRPIR